MVVKECGKCGVEKPTSEFYWQNPSVTKEGWNKAGRFSTNCKKCVSVQRKAHCAKDPHAQDHNKRRRHLKVTFNITPHQFDEMLESQGGVCGICKTDTPGGQGNWHVDHDHTTGFVRGLLCMRCNHKLGIKEDIEWNRAATDYIIGAFIRGSW